MKEPDPRTRHAIEMDGDKSCRDCVEKAQQELDQKITKIQKTNTLIRSRGKKAWELTEWSTTSGVGLPKD